MEKIKNFTDLYSWQQAHQFVLQIYHLIDQFPTKERFALTDQMRRSAISVTSNIAEGFARKHVKEKIQFYNISLGSLSELQNQLILANDLKYITSDYEQVFNKSIEIQKIICGAIRSLSKKHHS